MTTAPAQTAPALPKKSLLLLGQVMVSPSITALQKHFEVHHFPTLEGLPEQLTPFAESIEAVATGFVPGLPGHIMAALPNLKIIAVDGVGTDRVDMVQAKERGIPVTTEAGMPTNDVADMAMALLMSLRRNLLPNDQWVRAGKWAKQLPPLSQSLEGCKMGVAGFGHIGQAIARRGAACEMEIGYFQRRENTASPHTYFPDFTALAQWADVLVMAVPGTPETENMVNATVLEALGPQGLFINIARGSVVVEPALIHALKTAGIAGAGLDVYRDEPNINPEFLTLGNNVLLSPHQASATLKGRLATGADILEKLLKFFKGEAL